MNRPIYIARLLLNTPDLAAWAAAQGFTSMLAPGELHATILYCPSEFDWNRTEPQSMRHVSSGGDRSVEVFGDGVAVLRFADPVLEKRHADLLAMGATSNFDEFLPHVTLTYHPGDTDIDKVEPYTGPLIFSGESFHELDPDSGHTQTHCTLLKGAADDEQRIAYGWASVWEFNGREVTDLQDDRLDVPTMVDAFQAFMENTRDAKVLHAGREVGQVVYGFPLTREIADAMGLKTKRYGTIIGMRVDDDDAWSDVKAGRLRMFSVGGTGTRSKE